MVLLLLLYAVMFKSYLPQLFAVCKKIKGVKRLSRSGLPLDQILSAVPLDILPSNSRETIKGCLNS